MISPGNPSSLWGEISIMLASLYKPVSTVVSLNFTLTYRHFQKATFPQVIKTEPKYKINTWNLTMLSVKYLNGDNV